MKKLDIVLIIFLILFSFIFIVKDKFFASNSNDKYIAISVDGKEYKNLEFKDKTYIYPLKTKYGFNKIEIAKDYVRVLEADCPNKLDVLQGKIHSINQSIVCIPNRMIIEIKSKSDKKDSEELDAVIKWWRRKILFILLYSLYLQWF